MRWIKILFYNLAAILVLFLLADFAFTTLVRGPNPFGPSLQIHEAFYYTLKAQQQSDTLCTDKNGFKVHCSDINRSSLSSDVVFIGDSFTLGAGLPYGDTFVGMYDLAHPSLKVTNLAVSSYSPSRYSEKISYYLNKGLKTRHVVVFIDKNDIYDEIRYYRYKLFLNQDVLFFIYKNFHILSKIIKYLLENYEFWKAPIGKSKGIELSLNQIEKLWSLLNQHNIKLSIGVYPHLKELGNNNEEQHSYITIWRQFCEQKCFAFINAFPAFLRLQKKLDNKEKYLEKYTKDDRFHFNKNGNQVLFEVINKEFKIGQVEK